MVTNKQLDLSEEARQARNAYHREYKKNMTVEQQERKRAYQRDWTKKNRDKVRQHQENYWIRKAEEMKINQ